MVGSSCMLSAYVSYEKKNSYSPQSIHIFRNRKTKESCRWLYTVSGMAGFRGKTNRRTTLPNEFKSVNVLMSEREDIDLYSVHSPREVLRTPTALHSSKVGARAIRSSTNNSPHVGLIELSKLMESSLWSACLCAVPRV